MRPLRLLYVSYFYPLGGGSGSHRTARLARQFSKLGWQVTVLTGPPPPGVTPPADLPYVLSSVASLLDRHFSRRSGSSPAAASGGGRIPDRVAEPVRSSRLRELLRQVAFLPDPQIYWIVPAIAAARRALSGGRADAVFCSGPPFSGFLVGRVLKALGWSPLALDYRDVWLDHPWWPLPRWRQGIERWLEGRCLAAADLVIVNHDSMQRGLLDRHPEAADRCLVVPNGFDPEELGPPVDPVWRPGETFEMVYAGTLYGPVTRSHDDPDPLSVQRPVAFFAALRALSRRGVFGSGGVRATFLGASPGTTEAANLEACAREQGVAEIVRVLPRREKAAVVPLLRRAHLQFNILYYTEAQVAQKVYDYLHLGIPILSLLRESEANASIVRRAGAGPIVDPADADGIAAAVQGVVEAYRAGRPPLVRDRSYIDQFDVRVQAARIDARLRSFVQGRRGNGGRVR